MMTMNDYPPSVNAVRRRLVERLGPAADKLRPGILTGLCRLSLANEGVDEIAAVAQRWHERLVGEPADEELRPLIGLLAYEIYGGNEEWRPAADAPAALIRRLAVQGVRRLWLCRGQALTLSDGRRLVDIIGEAGVEPHPYGTTNRCRIAQIREDFRPGDGLLWAACGAFRLGGFIQHPSVGGLTALAVELDSPPGIVYDAWSGLTEADASVPTALCSIPGLWLVRGFDAAPPMPVELRRLFHRLREMLPPPETP